MSQCFSNTNPCPDYPNARCVYYSGSNLLCTGIKTNDRLDVILAKIDTAICTHTSSTTYIEAGAGIDIDGVGTVNNPYIISAIGGGTVTSFDANDLLPVFTTSVATPTTTPILSFSLLTQLPNVVFAGPASGSGATPTFRALVQADIPTTLTGYIQNQFAGPQASSNWWISANGRVGGYMQIASAARLVTDRGGTLSVTESANSDTGTNLRVSKLLFFDQLADLPTYGPRQQFSNAEIYSDDGQHITIACPLVVDLRAPIISIGDGISAPIIIGVSPITIRTGDSSGNTIFDAYQANTSSLNASINMVMSLNRDNGTPINPITNRGDRQVFAAIGIQSVDVGLLTYKGDLTFSTVSAIVNAGVPTEYMRLKYNGGLIVKSLDTGGIAPTTTGVTKTVICDGDGLLSFIASESTVLADFYTDVSNVGTAETDLYSYTVPANTFSANGEKIMAKYSLKFSNPTLSNKFVKAYFAGSEVLSTTAFVGSQSASTVEIMVIRSGASTVRVYAALMVSGGSIISAETDVAGVTFSSTNIVKITGTVTGAGATNGDITAKLGTIFFYRSA